MSRLFPLVALLGLLLASPAHGSASVGGAFNAPGERSHNIALGWPEIHYMWEGLVRDKVALGPRVDVRVWPFVVDVGVQMRFQLIQEGKATLSLLVHPSIGYAGFGGARADYPLIRLFQSRAFDSSVGVGVNVGGLLSVKVAHKWHVLGGFENPVAVWVFPRSLGWFVEWPFLLTVGGQFDVNFRTSVWARIGGGPALLFSGPTLSIGGHGSLTVGAQFRY